MQTSQPINIPPRVEPSKSRFVPISTSQVIQNKVPAENQLRLRVAQLESDVRQKDHLITMYQVKISQMGELSKKRIEDLEGKLKECEKNVERMEDLEKKLKDSEMKLALANAELEINQKMINCSLFPVVNLPSPIRKEICIDVVDSILDITTEDEKEKSNDSTTTINLTTYWRKCSKCGEEKQKEDFSIVSGTGKPKAECKKCIVKRQIDYRKRKAAGEVVPKEKGSKQLKRVKIPDRCWEHTKKDAVCPVDCKGRKCENHVQLKRPCPEDCPERPCNLLKEDL